MTLKIVHTKDGRTLYKDLDTGHWVPKDKAESILSQIKAYNHNRAVKQDEDLRAEQIRKQQEEAKRLNDTKDANFNLNGFEHKYTTTSASNGMPFTEWYDPKSGWTVARKVHQPGYALGYATWLIRDENGKVVEQIRSSMESIDSSQAWQESIFKKAADYVKRRKNPDPYKDILGPKKDVDPIEAITRCKEQNTINPNYVQYGGKENKSYHTNCALCTAAVALQARGYDVEAMPRDKDKWRGPITIFDVDFSNPDNFILGDSTHTVLDSISPTRNPYTGKEMFFIKVKR